MHDTRIASNGDYSGSVVVAYQLNAKFYGHPTPYMSEQEVVEELRKYGIRYYVAWGEDPQPAGAAFRKLKDLTVPNKAMVSLYAVEPGSPDGFSGPATR